MICPSCGNPNDDSVFECSHCFYKFRPFHNYKSPAKFAPGQKDKIIRNVKYQMNIPGKRWIIIVGFILFGLMYTLPLILQMLQ